MLPNFKLFKAF